MTRNEARADNNMPPIEGGDEIITPLNVLVGGQASPQDTHMDEQKSILPLKLKGIKPPECDCKECKGDPVSIKAVSYVDEEQTMSETLLEFFKRQAKSVLPKIGAGSDWWDEERWNAELADDIEPVLDAIADRHGEETAKAIGSRENTTWMTLFPSTYRNMPKCRFPRMALMQGSVRKSPEGDLWDVSKT